MSYNITGLKFRHGALFIPATYQNENLRQRFAPIATKENDAARQARLEMILAANATATEEKKSSSSDIASAANVRLLADQLREKEKERQGVSEALSDLGKQVLSIHSLCTTILTESALKTETGLYEAAAKAIVEARTDLRNNYGQNSDLRYAAYLAVGKHWLTVEKVMLHHFHNGRSTEELEKYLKSSETAATQYQACHVVQEFVYSNMTETTKNARKAQASEEVANVASSSALRSGISGST